MVLLPDPLKRLPNTHLRRLEEYFGPQPLRPQLKYAQKDFVFICFTNRSGSNFLADLLYTTGQANLAREFFNHDFVIRYCNKRKLTSFMTYFDHLCRNLGRRRFIFSKLAAPHLVVLDRYGVLKEIISRSRFILMDRSDKLAQAVSMAIAQQSGQWTSDMPARIPTEQLSFDPVQIRKLIKSTLEREDAMRHFFALNGIAPYTMVYERLSEDPEGRMRSLFAWLGLDGACIDPRQLLVQRQSSSVNAAWREQFLAAASALVSPAPAPKADSPTEEILAPEPAVAAQPVNRP